MFQDDEWDDIFGNLNRFGDDNDCSCDGNCSTEKKKECCEKKPEKKEPDPDICPKCGGNGRIHRCACICERCGNVIWGC